MFRLSKGNQSRKNHKIIHQTTKVSETDAPLSTPALNAAQHEAEQGMGLAFLSITLNWFKISIRNLYQNVARNLGSKFDIYVC